MTAKEVYNAYMREYRKKNREKLLMQEKRRRMENPERYQEYTRAYWERKAEQLNKEQEN